MANLSNRQIISDIMDDLRAVNLDDKISKRYILNKLRDFTGLFIKRDADNRRLLSIADLWTEVPCVELCEASIMECCEIDIPNCKTVMKSKFKIPETYETMYKELLQVYSVEYGKEFRQITPQEYRDITLREYQDKRIKYFWLSDNYLIVPDALVSTVTLRGVFVNPFEAKKLNSCLKEELECSAFLDQPFVCPDYLIPVIKQEVLKDLFSFYKRNVLDEEPNLNTNKKIDKDI